MPVIVCRKKVKSVDLTNPKKKANEKNNSCGSKRQAQTFWPLIYKHMFPP